MDSIALLFGCFIAGCIIKEGCFRKEVFTDGFAQVKG